MIAVILAGGLGTRFGSLTKKIPKPMIQIYNEPILIKIIKLYIHHDVSEFVILTGYKNYVIDSYLSKKSYKKIKNNSNYLTYHLFLKKRKVKVSTLFTGNNTLTGKRIWYLKKIFKDTKISNFFLTYGDGLCDVNITDKYKFHVKHNKLVTMTVVRPPVRFGEVDIKGSEIINFEEKPQVSKSWINGGFFVVNINFLKKISPKNVMLEKEPIKKLVKKKQIKAFPYKGLWYCMDNQRDQENINKSIKKNISFRTKLK
jgi:glucose-1-phosphate cytidylyltransferase